MTHLVNASFLYRARNLREIANELLRRLHEIKCWGNEREEKQLSIRAEILHRVKHYGCSGCGAIAFHVCLEHMVEEVTKKNTVLNKHFH